MRLLYQDWSGAGRSPRDGATEAPAGLGLGSYPRTTPLLLILSNGPQQFLERAGSSVGATAPPGVPRPAGRSPAPGSDALIVQRHDASTHGPIEVNVAAIDVEHLASGMT